MHERPSPSVLSPSRPTTARSRHSIPHGDSSEDRSSDSPSHTLLHDTDGGLYHDSESQMRIHSGPYENFQTHRSLENSTRSNSPTSVPSSHPSGYVETVEPPDNSSPSSPRLTLPQEDVLHSPADKRYMLLLRNWKWEILSMMTSLGLLAGIIVTLGRYNLTQQPEWPYNINTNYLASVITAIIIAQLGFILAEIISQLKWSWFKRPHPLQDLEDYDSASRGMIGSLTFLGRFAKQPRAYLAVGAAFLLLTSAAIGPFTQQSIKSYACQRPLLNSTASIPIASWINSSLVLGNDRGRSAPNLKMMTAALEGLLGSEDDSKLVPVDCPTGNCDFDAYSSMAYCSSCVDVTPNVIEESTRLSGVRYWRYILPIDDCELLFEDTRGHPDLGTKSTGDSQVTHLVTCTSYGMSSTAWDGSANFIVLSMSWANCSHDHEDGRPDSHGCGSYPEQLPSLANTSGLVAMNCTLGLCVKDYTAGMRNGVLEERNTGSLFPGPMSDEQSMFRMLKIPCIIDKDKYDRSNISQVPKAVGRAFTTVNFEGGNTTVPLECVYEADNDVPAAIGNFLGSDVFQTNYQIFQTYETGVCGLDIFSKGSWCRPWYMEPLFHSGRLTAETISADMDSIARSISNRMRVVGSNAYRNGSGFAPGRVIQTTVCVQVNWPWLILPAALVLLTSSLLFWVAITATCSQVADGRPVWKFSALVAFFHGIDARLRTPDTANEHTAGPVGSPGEADNAPSPISLPRPDTGVDLMSLNDMHTRAKRAVVKLDVAAPGRRGFVLVSEAQDEHRLVSSKQDGARRSADSHGDGEILPLTQLSSHGHIHGQGPSFLHVDLGVGFTPSVRDSLDRSRQQSFEDSLERGAGTG